MLRHTGVLQLPGTLAATELLSAEDGRGGRYGLVRDRHTGYLTATLRVVPASTWLADTGDADGWVANWGAWLASLGYLPALRWVTVTVDTAPDPGSTLTDQVAAAIDPSAPRAALEIMDQLVATAPAAAADVDTRVSITFDPAASPAAPEDRQRGGHRDRADADRAWNRRSGSCGVTVLGRARAADIAGIVRTAFDPAVRGEVNRLLASGISPALEEQLNWASAGPAGAEERWDCYQHDSGISVTYAWREAPRQNVRSDVLARLVAPGPYPKRVSLQYRPFPAAGRGRDAGQRGPRGRSSAASTPAAPAATSPPATPTTTPAPGRPPTRKPAAPGSACSACTSRSPSPTPPSCPARPPTPRPPPSPRRSGCSACTAARPPGSPPPCPAASACPNSPAGSGTDPEETAMMSTHLGHPSRRVRTSSRSSAPPTPPAAPDCHPAGPPAPHGRAAGRHQLPSAEPLAPAWGWKIPDGGRAVHVAPRPEYQATTTQLCGLFPFVAGSGTPAAGTPVGRHQLWGEVVCLDPLAWLRAGLVTNPGMFVLGQPGTGKSALVKRLVTGAVAFGTRVADPRRHQARLHPADPPPRRAGHPHRPRPGHRSTPSTPGRSAPRCAA